MKPAADHDPVPAGLNLDQHLEYRLLAESIPNLAWIAHADGAIYWYNQRWFEYTGTTLEQMQGWGWQSVHDPAILPQVLASFRASIHSGEPFEMTFPLRGADGVYRPFLTRTVPLKDSEGRVLRWFGTNTEVGEFIRMTSALQESELRFRTAIAAVSAVIWTNDAEGRMQGEQPGWSSFTGQAIDQYQGYGWSKALHPEDAQPTIDAWEQAVRDRRLFAFEHRVRRHDGVYRLCSVRSLPVSDAQGTLRGWVGVHTDITDERANQQALRDTNERLSIALTAANGVGTWDWDIPNDRIYSNEGLARIFGFEPEDGTQGVSFHEFTRNVHPADLERVTRDIQAAIQSGEEYRCEYRLMQPDGSICWLSAVGRCRHDPAGRPLRFPGVGVDITAVRHADDALRMSEENFRIAADVARLGHCRLDTHTRTLITSTDNFRANFGRLPDDPFTYADLLASIHPEDLDRVKEAIQAAIQNNAPYHAEYRVLWPDGSLHWISATGKLLQFTDGRSPEIAGVTMDVTQKRLSEATLLQTEKLAAVGRLASSIAHEINNPLESITNLLYIARNSADITEIRHMLDIAEQELRRVSIIANQTLRFHKQSSYPKETSCLDLFSTVLSMYEGKLRNSGIVVEKRKRLQRPVRIYEGDIRQVLNNLVGNAIDAMPTGGRLLVRSRQSKDWRTGEPGVILTVADTGCGISPETQKKMFDAFFTTKGIGGTGLGLWISAEIMQRHAGSIRIRSSQDPRHRGTVINLFLPFNGAVKALTPDPSQEEAF